MKTSCSVSEFVDMPDTQLLPQSNLLTEPENSNSPAIINPITKTVIINSLYDLNNDFLGEELAIISIIA